MDVAIIGKHMILQIHAPNGDTPNLTKDDFEQVLETQIDKILNSRKILLIRYFNDRVDKQKNSKIV